MTATRGGGGAQGRRVAVSRYVFGSVVTFRTFQNATSPRTEETEPTEFGSCEAAAIAIIGGTDGSTAICFDVPQEEHLYAACSALHFEPVHRVKWYPVVHVSEHEAKQFTLI